MIISNPNSPTMSHGALKTYAVDISKGAGRFVVFDTLIDGLYRNKVRIVVQEYSSNARDANIEAGIPDTPIEVQLPTSDIPKFAVRDFGLGISPDRMADVFCNLGESTKRDGNAQTGGFGLGAKCGYAYAKMSTGKFRIITVFGNTKYSYVAYINDGAPYIDLVDEEATTERSGTTIIMDVKPYHITDFIESAKDIYKHWTIRPMFHGRVIDFTEFDSSVAHQEDGVKLFGKRCGIIFTIAGIPYSSPTVYYNNVNAVIELPNGAVTLIRSREDIERTDANSKVMEKYIEKAKAISRRLADAKIKDCKNIFEASLIASKIWHDSHLKFNGISLTDVEFGINTAKASIRTPKIKYEFATSTYGNRSAHQNVVVIWKDGNFIKNILSRIGRYVSENPTVMVIYVAGRCEYLLPIKDQYFTNAIALSSLPTEERLKVKAAAVKAEPVTQCLIMSDDNKYEIEKTVPVSSIDKTALHFVYSKVETSEGTRSNAVLFHKRAAVLKLLANQGKTVIGFPKSFEHIPKKLDMPSLSSYLELIITARKTALDADRKIYNTIEYLNSRFGSNSWHGVELKKVVNAPEKFKKAISLIDSIEMYLYSRIIPKDSQVTEMDQVFLNEYKHLIYMSADKFSSISELESVLFGGRDA